MFRNQKLQRTIAALVLTTFTSLTLYPLTAAAQVKKAMEAAGEKIAADYPQPPCRSGSTVRGQEERVREADEQARPIFGYVWARRWQRSLLGP